VRYTIKSSFKIESRDSFVIVLNAEIGSLTNENILFDASRRTSLSIDSVEEVKVEDEYFTTLIIRYTNDEQYDYVRSLKSGEYVYLEQI
jgi:hypothetical protein